MQDLLKILLEEFHAKLPEVRTSQARDFRFSEAENLIKVAIGMRRVGKTYCMLQKIQSLLEEPGVEMSQILYLNLEDDRLLPCAQEKLRDLVENFYTLYPENHERLCYLFFDEIQNVENWPVLIRRIFDTKKVQIFLTGSSAKLLSSEIHTSLRGRALAGEVWPYSFHEFLLSRKIRFSGRLLGKKKQDQLFQKLRQYLKTGGFPEATKVLEIEARQLLQSYVDVVIMRDVIERHGITNIVLIKYLIKFLLKNIGGSFSVHKFFNDLKAQGLSGAKTTLYDYLSYIEEAYLVFTVPLYSESVRKTQTNPRKIYAVDPGLVTAYSFGFSENYGHLFENLVFLDLKRRGYKIYYYLTKERYEIDFLAFSPLGKMELFQVVWDISNKETQQRELRALQAAEQELNIKGQLITPASYMKDLWARMNL
jgi:uncharacterized protein